MAHNLNFAKGRYSFFTVKEKAWHKLGQVLEHCPRSSEAIKHAGLDFEVVLGQNAIITHKKLTWEEAKTKKLVIKDNEPPTKGGKEAYEAGYYEGIHADGRFGTYRKDTMDYLGGIVGTRYNVVQNVEAFGFFDSLVEGEFAHYETAGCLGKGEVVFITAKLPNHMVIGRHDIIDKYCVLYMNHDGKGSVTVLFTPIRVVCNNTLTAAISGATNKITIRHTASAQRKLKDAKNLLGLANKSFDSLEERFAVMSKTTCSDDAFQGLLSDLYLNTNEREQLSEGAAIKEVLSTRKVNIIKDVMAYREKGPGQDLKSCYGTVFGAYNAITGHTSNAKPYRDADLKFKNMFQQGEKDIMQRAFHKCMELCV